MITNYTIKKGDTLWAIGRHVGLNWRFISAMNPQIKDPNKIFVDQVITIPNPTLVKNFSLFADLVLILCPYKIGVAISLLRFLIEAGSFIKADVAKFLIQQGIDGIFAAKVEAFYYGVGKDSIGVIYDWWSRFWNFGINKIIDKDEK